MAQQFPTANNLTQIKSQVRNHDITCIVESKTDDRDEIKLPGYIFRLKKPEKNCKS